MFEAARAAHATHLAMIDADEVLTANLLHGIRDEVKALGPKQMLQVPLYNLRHGLWRYHANGIWSNRWVSLAFRDHPDYFWSGDQFHHREPFTWSSTITGIRSIAQGLGGVLHLWGAHERRLVAKHALYKLIERQRWPDRSIAKIDRLYSLAIDGAGQSHSWTFSDVPLAWWGDYLQPTGGAFDVPWQEHEVARILDSTPELAEGLQLWGLSRSTIKA
jgi:hypothetical protein